MYDFLEGLVEQHSTTRLVLATGGVGYELSVPLGAPFATGRRARVWTHLVVREDAQLLYGFADAPTRDLFRAMIRISGIGPRTALGVLSGLSREELLEAIALGDRTRLLALKGVGKRIVDQLLLQLTEKAQALLAAERAAHGDGGAASPTAPAPVVVDDAVAALISIGYAEKDARKQVERAALSVGAVELEQLVRAALAG